MSSQEPPFEQPGEEPPPEQQPGEERGIPRDPRERPGSEFAAPQTPPPVYPPQGYPPPPPGYVPPQGYPPPPGYYAGPVVAPRRRRGPWLGCLIAFIIILFLCAAAALVGTLLGFGLGVGGALRNSVTVPARTFPVGASPALILTSDAGSVTVNRGSTNSIVVQAKKYASFGGNFNDLHINYGQSGSTVTVAVQRSGTFNFFNSTSVDFTITVPPVTDLQLTTNAGSINFTGAIGTTGTYDFETNAGSINMTLPATASFHVNATTDVGSINTNFPVTVNHSGAGAIVNGDVGTAPQATLTLKADAGSISLNRG
jgi:hypothetical protein